MTLRKNIVITLQLGCVNAEAAELFYNQMVACNYGDENHPENNDDCPNCKRLGDFIDAEVAKCAALGCTECECIYGEGVEFCTIGGIQHDIHKINERYQPQ